MTTLKDTREICADCKGKHDREHFINYRHVHCRYSNCKIDCNICITLADNFNPITQLKKKVATLSLDSITQLE
jgi:hypothetical protein